MTQGGDFRSVRIGFRSGLCCGASAGRTATGICGLRGELRACGRDGGRMETVLYRAADAFELYNQNDDP